VLSPKLTRYFEEYTDYHRHPTNRLTHKIAIPLIVFHVIAMLTWVRLGEVEGVTLTLGHVAWVLSALWYLSLDLRLGVVLTVLFALCFPLAATTPAWAVWVIAVAGWTIQLAGHMVWEKRAPAFLTNLVQALIGPMFFVAVLMGLWPQKQPHPSRS
jgi:uncharacterized membrane protein YGL010W